MKSAEEGSLHEIEFIRDKVNDDGKIKPTIFMGYFFVKNIPLKFEIKGSEVKISFTNSTIDVNGVKLNEIWIGGEKNYGFGRVRILLNEFRGDKVNMFNSGMMVNVANEQLIISSEEKRKIALSHVNIEKLNTELIKGDIEPLVGREWSERGPGQKISSTVKVCIVPGSEFHYDREIYVGDFGIWEIV